MMTTGRRNRGHGLRLQRLLLAILWVIRQQTVAFDVPNVARRRRCFQRFLKRGSSLFVSKQHVPIDPDDILSQEDVDQVNLLVEQRSRARWNGNYKLADDLRATVEGLELTMGYRISMQDIPRKLGGGTNWTLVHDNVDDEVQLMEGPTILQLAHASLGHAVERTSRSCTSSVADVNRRHQEEQNNMKLEKLLQQAKNRLHQQAPEVLQYELSGRKAADAAFWFALSGVNDEELYQDLAMVATNELQRFGSRSSCRRKDICQILERFAAAGIRRHDPLLNAARQCLATKSNNDDDEKNNTESSSIPTLLDFHSDRSLMLLWKFSTKQKKQRAFFQSAIKHWESLNHRQQQENESTVGATPTDAATAMGRLPITSHTGTNGRRDWNDMFDDPNRPLVVDIGCGMGVSLLGLASMMNDTGGSCLPLSNDLQLSDCNFVGVDLGRLGIGYASSIASRWCIDGRLQFVVDAAESFVQTIHDSYPGPVVLCLIQFPTPYKLDRKEDMENSGGGNSQLPRSAHDGFMVSEHLLSLVHEMLVESEGKLMLQSNCEDVAVWMRKAACSGGGFEYLNDSSTLASYAPSTSPLQAHIRIPQRTKDWIAMGGERAQGPGWFKEPLLPRKGATETEVACILNGTPVHRCLLVPRP